jgi:plasmid rolling circle replication initiator protein Rep
MDRIARYSGLKNRSRDMAQYLRDLKQQNPNREDIKRLAVNVTGCANYLVFHDYYTVDQVRLVKARTCKKSLLCPFCAARRAAKLVDKYLGTVQAVIGSEASLKPVMITLTVKNGESLKERYNHLKTAYRTLQKHRRHAIEGQKWTEFAKVHGAIHSYEFTKSANGWHPHIHMVALVSDWIDQKALSSEWQAITGDSFIVDIRRISSIGDADLASGMLEVFKYALKFQDLTLSDTWHAYEILNGKRLMGSFGNLRGVQAPDSLLDDPLEHLPYLELLYVFAFRSGAYDLKTTKIIDAVQLPSVPKQELLKKESANPHHHCQPALNPPDHATA